MADIILRDETNLKLNKIGLDLLNKINDIANLPSGRLLLVFNNGPLFNNYLGVTDAYKVTFLNKGTSFFSKYQDNNWDCGIALSLKACNFFFKYPAYFVYLLGHEFGHAHVCWKDLSLHVFYCLIQNHIREASIEKITKWHELPHEILFDKYGIFISGKIYSRQKFNSDVEKMIEDPDFIDNDRLKNMLKLRGTSNLTGLRKSLVQFSLPYKDRLIDLWEESKKVEGDTCLASLINDYDELFKTDA